ncbi:EXS family-domain-containing protein [Dichotomocladium elegans]|nr:EXS family-domain-containing protein [Dichotomocladium elegans]
MDKLDPHYQDIAAVRSKPLSIFVKKLWIIVNDPGSDQLIRWDDSGRSIWILDANQFSKTVVPCYFKHSNWHSFVRQLNLYGFRKVCDLYPGDGDGSGGGDIDHRLNDTWQFRNSFFRRNQPHLLHFVKRNRKGRLPRQSTPHHGLIASATGSSIIPRIPSVGGPDHQQEQPDVDVALRRLEMIEHDLQGVEMQGISVQQNITAMRNLQYRQSQVLINLLGLTKLLAQTSHFHDSRALQVDVTQQRRNEREEWLKAAIGRTSTFAMDTDGGSPMPANFSLLHSALPDATYRPIVIFTIGLWGWGLNLYLLSKYKIDPSQLLQGHSTEKHAPLHKTIFSLAAAFTGLVCGNMGWYLIMERASVWVPLICYLSAIGLVFWPGKRFYYKERERFIRMLGRLLTLNLKTPVFFGDVIMADILTSFSNVFGDLFTSVCSALGSDPQDNACHRDIFVPLLISLPYLIRLKQCLAEYLESNRQTQRHLLNALKYASAFPVIILSATEKRADYWVSTTGSVPSTWWVSDTNLFRLWMFFVCVNSMYSFWWDISIDWSLMQLTSSPMNNHGERGTPILQFRRTLHFQHPFWYYCAMMIDFVLRTTWSLKLSSHLFVQRLEGSIFTMELLEVIRRWVWVIFRMEWEWIRRLSGSVLPTDDPDGMQLESLHGSKPN